MSDLITTIINTAPLNIDILLLGETGTGKDTLAQRIHCLKAPCSTISCKDCWADAITRMSTGINRVEPRRSTPRDSSTRSITLTAEGALFLERSRRILAVVEAAEQELTEAATTPVDPRVAQKMSECLLVDGNFGNPASRSHVFGWKAEEAVENARRQVADLVNADPREIVWTSGATESDNLAIKGAES